MMPRTTIIPLLSLLLALTGCISSTRRCYTPTPPAASLPIEQKAITFSFNRNSYESSHGKFDKYRGSSWRKSWMAKPRKKPVYVDQFNTTFKQHATQINETADGRGAGSDIHMNVLLQNSFSYFPCVLRGLLGYLIPVCGTDTYTLYAEVADRNGREKTYQIAGEIDTYTCLPLLFAMPFCQMPWSGEKQVTQENWTELLHRMENDGFFTKSTTK